MTESVMTSLRMVFKYARKGVATVCSLQRNVYARVGHIGGCDWFELSQS